MFGPYLVKAAGSFKMLVSCYQTTLHGFLISFLHKDAICTEPKTLQDRYLHFLNLQNPTLSVPLAYINGYF
jgi:hypothetical protein